MVSVVIKSWFPLAFVLTVVCFVGYISFQQNYRQNANHPQIQIAEDVSKLASRGVFPDSTDKTKFVDIQSSLAPFYIVYDSNGQPIGGNGLLNAKYPTPPSGVFATAKSKGQYRVTWQPMRSVRLAAVVQYYQNGTQSVYVVAARSLTEVENRIQQISNFFLFGWLIGLIGSLFLIIILSRLHKTN